MSQIDVSSGRSSRGWRVRDAWRALRRLFKNPDDTRAVFEVIDALPGRSAERAFRRFRKTETGRRVLAEQRDLIARLADRGTLLALPEGTLGHTYAEFMSTEQISADGLVDASAAAGREPDADPDRRRFFARLRDKHDLEHVVTGFGRDLRGEAGLLAFTFAQIPTPGIGLIVGMAYLESGPQLRRVIRDGFRRGRRSAWMAGADWERLLELPLDEARRALGIRDLPQYEPVYSAGAPAAAANA